MAETYSKLVMADKVECPILNVALGLLSVSLKITAHMDILCSNFTLVVKKCITLI